ncbi:short chain dehydrogenase/oxidoreductase [Aspergillus heteromorphus CBS 117.55]|uniref:Short chain dehydrogenase/oxidoreductase n=1 Tax=Aspergillus heteromorphus CBS 117.55 TaxID=1448321 RepID=A0A317VPB9_9EURO|nr:short chain dehydrogenase/oxidoreductase [Aspergillus heteromorphus CBS 117.55]PWY75111.1 short chain dehydrogenase/oxidoreductase [Aspergillus heteromorphus CBS 117.55]
MHSPPTKTCLITGGASGLGKAIATRFFTAGMNVIICDINESRLQQTSLDLAGPTGSPRLKTIKTDITGASEVQTLFETITAEFHHLDILVNNAGIMDRFDPVGDLDEGLWDKVLAVNLTAPFLLSKLAVKSMLGREVVDGCILNIVSTAGKAGFLAGAAYTASKHGLVGLTKNTASFYGAKGIRCNALMMGGMMTNITDAFTADTNLEGRDKMMQFLGAAKAPLVDVDQVAELCFSVACGPGSRLLNGTCIPVDHGLAGLLG